MSYDPQSFDKFFAPLVGDQTQAKQLHEELAASVTGQNIHIPDPYARLGLGLRFAIRKSTREHVAGLAPGEAADSDWTYIATDAQFGGGIIVAALRAVGDIYVKEAIEPQAKTNVAKNTYGVLRHVYGIAFSGTLVGIKNLNSMRYGLSPRNPFAMPVGIVAGDFTKTVSKPKINRRAFIAETDTDGQIAITPRHKLLRDTSGSGRKCPATDARVTTSEGVRPALMTLIKTVGGVAITEIYPYQFDIVDLPKSNGGQVTR